MEEKRIIVPLGKLNLTNRFLFDEVMEDPQTHQDTLSIIFGKEIPLLEENKTEKELRITPSVRSIRMDVFAMDEEKTVYNTEMQKQKKTDLLKRSRYYQGMIDTSLLQPGIPNYNQLNQSYIIMITPFDLFGYKKYRYTFEAKCNEIPECRLNDGAVRIFLNTRGENDDEVSGELVEFLHYLENTTDEAAENSGSERIRRIQRRVREVKSSEEIGVKYMQAWEEKYYEREEGARAKLREQVKKNMERGKSLREIAEWLGESEELLEELLQETSVETGGL